MRSKSFLISYAIFGLCLIAIYFWVPNTNSKFYLIAFLPIIFWLPKDIKRYIEWKQKKTESNSQH